LASQPATWHANLLDFETCVYEPGGNVSQKQGRYVEDTTTYAYTADGKLKQQTNPDGTSLSRRYDTLGHLVMEETQPLGVVTTIQTDDIARSVATTTTSGTKSVTNRVIADRRGNPIATTDTLNQTTTATYDRLNRVKTQIGAPAAVGSAQDTITFYYDAAGLVTKSTNALDESVVVTKDVMDRTIETEVLDSAGGVVKRTKVDFYANHHGSAVTEGSGREPLTLVTYVNQDGQPLLIIDGAGKFERLSYDVKGRLVQSRDKEGNISSLAHDALGRELARVDLNSALTRFTYEPGSLGTKVRRFMQSQQPSAPRDLINAPHIVHETQLDFLGRTVEERLLGEDGSVTRNFTTAYYTGSESGASQWKGMLRSVTDGRGVTTSREYDAFGRLAFLRATGPLPEHKMGNTYEYRRPREAQARPPGIRGVPKYPTTSGHRCPPRLRPARCHRGRDRGIDYGWIDRHAQPLDAILGRGWQAH